MKRLTFLVAISLFMVYLYLAQGKRTAFFSQEIRKKNQMSYWQPPPLSEELDTPSEPDPPTSWPPIFVKKDLIDAGQELQTKGRELLASLGFGKKSRHQVEDYLIKRLSAYRFSGREITNRPGYYELEAFIAPNYPSFAFLPFMELEGFYFDDDTYGANIGLGGRYLPHKFPPLVGFNIFGDYYQSTRGPLFQLSVGFELIAKKWELSANGYIPIGKKEQVCKSVFDQYIGDYKISCRVGQSSYPGFNLDVKWLAVQRQKKFFLYTFGGPYFFASSQDCTPSFWGGRVGIQPMYNDYISMTFSVSYDPVYEFLFQGKLMLTLPLYSSRLKGYRDSNKWIKRQIYQPVHKLDVMTIDKNCRWHANF